MQNIEFLKEEAQQEVFWALHNEYDDCKKDARDAVKAWARAAGISTTKAWLTIIREKMAYAQEVIDDVRAEHAQKAQVEELTIKITADFSEYESDLKPHLAGLAEVLTWNVGAEPDFSSMTTDDLSELIGRLSTEVGNRSFYIKQIANKSSDKSYGQRFAELQAMTGLELRKEILP